MVNSHARFLRAQAAILATLERNKIRADYPVVEGWTQHAFGVSKKGPCGTVVIYD